MTNNSEWKNIVNVYDLVFEADFSAENYHYEIAPEALSDKMGASKIGYNITALLPKQFSCPYHFHHAEEELFLVLEGSAILRQGDRFREVTKGDLIFFSTGTESAHQFYNHTDLPFRYLAISNRDKGDVCEYPDSKKIYVRQLKKVFQDGTQVDYLKDEQDPARYWPKEQLRSKETL